MIFNDEPVITKNNVTILILVILQPIIWFLVFIYNPDMTIDNFLGCIALSLFFILLISVLLLHFDREINENTLLLTILLFISEPFIFYSAAREEEGYVNYIFLFRDEYKPNVIKDCDSNLTEKEIKIIADNIDIIDYIPLFLDYRTKKNAEFEEKRRLEIKAQKKAEREMQKAQRIEKKNNKKLLDDFLSQKCKGAEKC